MEFDARNNRQFVFPGGFLWWFVEDTFYWYVRYIGDNASQDNQRIPFVDNISGGRKLDGNMPCSLASTGYFPGLTGLKMEVDMLHMTPLPLDKKMEMDDDHEVFLMYYPPSNGIGNFRVPVVSAKWNPHGSASKISGNWQLGVGSSISVGTAVSYPDFPIYPQ
jgi:hypothetical protein